MRGPYWGPDVCGCCSACVSDDGEHQGKDRPMISNPLKNVDKAGCGLAFILLFALALCFLQGCLHTIQLIALEDGMNRIYQAVGAQR